MSKCLWLERRNQLFSCTLTHARINVSFSIVFLYKVCKHFWLRGPGQCRRILEVLVLFRCTFIDTLCSFFSEIQNKIHIVNIACWLHLKYLYIRYVYAVKIKKKQITRKFVRGKGNSPACDRLVTSVEKPSDYCSFCKVYCLMSYRKPRLT